MYQVKDVIVYGSQGVCKITGIEEKTIAGSKKTYYVLKPVKDNGATIFAPTDNEHILKKMRKLLTAEEIDRLIGFMSSEEGNWIANESQRRELYKEILAGCDHLELIRMIKAIYQHKQEREAAGRRLHMTDERFLKDAEQLLFHEFQYVLKLNTKADLTAYILSHITPKEWSTTQYFRPDGDHFFGKYCNFPAIPLYWYRILLQNRSVMGNYDIGKVLYGKNVYNRKNCPAAAVDREWSDRADAGASV